MMLWFIYWTDIMCTSLSNEEGQFTASPIYLLKTEGVLLRHQCQFCQSNTNLSCVLWQLSGLETSKALHRPCISQQGFSHNGV